MNPVSLKQFESIGKNETTITTINAEDCEPEIQKVKGTFRITFLQFLDELDTDEVFGITEFDNKITIYYRRKP